MWVHKNGINSNRCDCPCFLFTDFSLHLPVSQYEAEILLHTLSKYSHEGHSRSLVEMYFLLPFYLRLLSFNVNLGMSSLHTKMTALVCCVVSNLLHSSFLSLPVSPNVNALKCRVEEVHSFFVKGQLSHERKLWSLVFLLNP